MPTSPDDRYLIGQRMTAYGRSREVTNGSLVAAKLTEDPCAKRRLRGSPDARSGSVVPVGRMEKPPFTVA